MKSERISPFWVGGYHPFSADWSALLQRYIDLNNRPLLPDAGRVTHEQAVEKALSEYDKFRVIQDREIMSDFDKQLKLLFENGK